MKKIKFKQEDVLNGYIATDDETITLVGTLRPDLKFDSLIKVIDTYNAYLDTGLTPQQITELKKKQKPKCIKNRKQSQVSYIDDMPLTWGRCPYCNWKIDNTGDFCKHCGQKIDWEKE